MKGAKYPMRGDQYVPDQARELVGYAEKEMGVT